jgi:hypothetical protein
MNFFENPNDSVIVKRVAALDQTVQKIREEDYSQWTRFVDHCDNSFPLADFIFTNLNDALPDLQNNTLEILWIACCSDHELYDRILQYSNAFLKRRHPHKLNVLRVDLAHFLQEVAETLRTEMGEDAKTQKQQFKLMKLILKVKKGF